MDVLLVLLAVFAAFYFILLRPVIQQQRRRRDDLSALDIGDEVLTTGGLFATIRDIETTDDGPLELALELAPGLVVRGTVDAVQQITRAAHDDRDDDDDDGYDPDDDETDDWPADGDDWDDEEGQD